jgi:hypothetical protein
VKSVAAFYVRQRVLKNERGVLEFSDAPWIRELRRLIKAYLRLKPEVALAIKELRSIEVAGSNQSRLARRETVGPASVERILVALAVNGPMRFSELGAVGKTMTSTAAGLRALEEIGLVVTRNVAWSERHVSLNGAHPVYKHILSLLLSVSGQRRRKGVVDFADATTKFEPRRLLWDPLRTTLLLAIEATPAGEADASVLLRRLPEFDSSKIYKRLHALQKQQLLAVRCWKTLKLYRLNEEYPYYGPLKVLLHAANLVWDDERKAASMDVRLHPPNRKALMKRKRRSTAKLA